jgi:hypothetical protein
LYIGTGWLHVRLTERALGIRMMWQILQGPGRGGRRACRAVISPAV